MKYKVLKVVYRGGEPIAAGAEISIESPKEAERLMRKNYIEPWKGAKGEKPKALESLPPKESEIPSEVLEDKK